MTRTSIERCAIAFIIALSGTFCWAIFTVLQTMGIL